MRNGSFQQLPPDVETNEDRSVGIHPVLFILAFIGGLAVVGILAAVAAKFASMMGIAT